MTDKELYEDVAKLKTDTVIIRRDVGRMIKLIEGNGRPPLMSRITTLELKGNQIGKVVWGSISLVLIAVLGSIVALVIT